MPETRPLRIHLIAVGGTGMAPLAALLAADGYAVTGSDGPLYPPMSTLLAGAGIRPFEGFAAANLELRPDLVIVGNAVRRDNPEAVECERLGIERLSMPEALARFYLKGRRPLVVAGTHGKTTTTAMAAWVYECCGREPGFLIGGVPIDLGQSFRRGRGERFVIEGDEYNAAYFDRGAKFLHYRPECAIVTSVEHDHVDLYPTAESFRAAFRRLVALVPADGLLVAYGDDRELAAIAAERAGPTLLYGSLDANQIRFGSKPLPVPEGMRFAVVDGEGEHEVRLGVHGEHNATNALAVWAAARRDGIEAGAVADALARFRGVKRRQELVGEARGVAVIDDFAHHPTAVGKTLAALRDRFPGRRLIAAFEPRSLTAGREFLLDGYRAAFPLADHVLLAPIFHRDRLSAEERLDLSALAEDLAAAGTPAESFDEVEKVLSRALDLARPGDVVVTMSSGSFSGMSRRLVAALAGGVTDSG